MLDISAHESKQDTSPLCKETLVVMNGTKRSVLLYIDRISANNLVGMNLLDE